jgi:hypothetical protein
VFRKRRQPRPDNRDNPDPRPGRSDARAARLAAELDADRHATRQPILTETEALVVVELLEQLTEQPVREEIVDLARTLIVRILDGLDTQAPNDQPTPGPEPTH